MQSLGQDCLSPNKGNGFGLCKSSDDVDVLQLHNAVVSSHIDLTFELYRVLVGFDFGVDLLQVQERFSRAVIILTTFG